MRIGRGLVEGGIVKATFMQTVFLREMNGCEENLFIRANAGMGKTMLGVMMMVEKAYAILDLKGIEATIGCILVATREESKHVAGLLDMLIGRENVETIRVLNISGDESETLVKSLMGERPAIIVSTPGRLKEYLEQEMVVLYEGFEMVIVDDVDLMFGFGYENTIRKIMECIPQTSQKILVSTALDKTMDDFRKQMGEIKMFDIDDYRDGDLAYLSHYSLRLGSVEDKYLVMYALLKIELIKGRVVIFTNSIFGSYKLKLFLEAFYIKCCVIDIEFPMASRKRLLQEISRGKYECIIVPDTDQKIEADLGKVVTAINFDFPKTSEIYFSRFGNAGKGFSGLGLSFVVDGDKTVYEIVLKEVKMENFTFDMNSVEGFRYRVVDVLGLTTKNTVMRSRVREIETEILRSEKLKEYFQSNPKDLEEIRRHQRMFSRRLQKHLKNIPQYLLLKQKEKSVVHVPVLDKHFSKILKQRMQQ